MKHKQCLTLISLTAAFFFLAGCGKESSDPDDNNNENINENNNENNNEDYVCGNDIAEPGEVCDGEDLAGETCESQGFLGGELACLEDCSGFDTSLCIEGEEPGEAHTLEVLMHTDVTKIYLESMTVISDPAADDYDIWVSHLDGPSFQLGLHVQAINMGNEIGFHELEEAPEDGYESDGEGLENLVIGTDYRTGGSGSTGYIMSENVYVLKLDHGDGDVTYGKIEVLQAQAGVVLVLAYWQADGTGNLLTAEPATM